MELNGDIQIQLPCTTQTALIKMEEDVHEERRKHYLVSEMIFRLIFI
jgi:hypothetical protein